MEKGQVQSPDEYFQIYSNLCQFEEGDPEYLIDKVDFKLAMVSYGEQVVRYTLEKAASSAKIEDENKDTYDLIWDKNGNEYEVSEYSILSLEEQIIKDLQL